MRRLLLLFPIAILLLACNLTERVVIPQQLPTLAVPPGEGFIAPTAVLALPASPTSPASPTPPEASTATIDTPQDTREQPTARSLPTEGPTLESITSSMVGEQESMVAALPTVTATPISSTSAPDCQPNTDWETTYTIVSGDRLSIIADRVGLTAQELAEANCIPNPDRISVGQVLRVPEGVVTAAPPSPIPLNTPDADGFTTYTNRDYGFSLRYPPGWNRVEPGSYINLVSPDGSNVFEILIDETGTSPQAQADACRAGAGCPRGASIEGGVIEVDGLPAYRIDLGGAGSLRVIVFLTLNGRDLAIRGFGDASVFEQILGTFTVP